MAAEEEKKPFGRPPIWDKPEALQDAIDAYFNSLEHKEKDPETNQEVITYSEPPTITGLAYSLGFASRQSFYDYEKDGDFSYTIKRARIRVEMAYERHLYSKTPSGAIFALKNFGWTDKQEIEHSGTISIPAIKWADEK